jgi:hypothetical protein
MPLSLPLLEPEDVVRHLGRGKLHWKAGRSAHALVTRWHEARGIPAIVRHVLDTQTAFTGAALVDAFLERNVDLPGGGRPTQTDLMAILRTGSELAIAAVEGKVDETFGPLVGEWLKENPGRLDRLNGLTSLFGPTARDPALRYQLFHRSASALLEAERYNASIALMLVHSFSAERAGFADYAAFLKAVGLSDNPTPGQIYGPKHCIVHGRSISFYAGWVADDCADIAAPAKFWQRLHDHALRSRSYAEDLLKWIEARSAAG